MRNAKEIFSSLSGTDVFQRTDRDHILDLYCGIDTMSRYTLLLISSTEPESPEVFKSYQCQPASAQRWQMDNFLFPGK